MSHITMSDVAKAVGVNKGTVSRALRGDRRISPQTREKVWEAAKKLGYQIDAVARGLSSKKTGMVGIAVDKMDVTWLGSFLGAVIGVLSRFKIETMLLDSGAASFEGVVRRAVRRKLDGLIWLGEHNLSDAKLEMPTVRVGSKAMGCTYRIDIEKKETMSRVKRLANGRKIVFREGPDSTMKFLADLQKLPCENALEPFIIWDGLRELPKGERPSLMCGNGHGAMWLESFQLKFPVRELGVLSARLLLNAIHERGSRPAVTLVKAPLFSTMGELILQ